MITPSLVVGVFVLIRVMSDKAELIKKKCAKDPVCKSEPAERPQGSFLMAVLYEAGLLQAPRCYSNYRFVTVLLVAVVILWLLHDLLPPFSSSIEFHWHLWLSLVIWQPLVEEILFRGIVQGQLRKRRWARQEWLRISAANLVTSILFVTVHLYNNPPLFSIAVIVPSLVFGYFRDTCHSVYPAILLHSAFNAIVIEALFIHGNMVKFPL